MSSIEYINSAELNSVNGIQFSSIPQNYSDLILTARGAASSNVVAFMQFGNGSLDTAANYSTTNLQGDGSSALSYRWSSQNYARAHGTGTGTGQGFFEINILSYSNTNIFKTVISQFGTGVSAVSCDCNLWRSTSSITNLNFYMSSGTFTGSVTLWGVK